MHVLVCIAVAVWLLFSPTLVLAQDSETGAEGQAGDDQPTGESAAAAQEQTRTRSVRRLGDVVGERAAEFSMDIPTIEMPAQPVAEQPDVSLPDGALDDRLQDILARRAYAPDDPGIEQELASLLDEVELQARQALAADNLELAATYADVLSAFDTQRDVVAEVDAERERRTTVQRLLAQAELALALGNLVEPDNASAWTFFQRAGELDQGNDQVSAGLERVRQRLLARADQFMDQGNIEAAESLLEQARSMDFEPRIIEQRRAAIERARENQRRVLIDQTRRAINRGNFDDAEDSINELIGIGLEENQVEQLRNSLDDAIRYGGYEPGQQFQDRLGDGENYGPLMVVMPSGSFMMGSREDEEERLSNEGPRFRVTFERGFALARTEITVAQFRRFVEATGYETDAERSGSSRIYLSGTGRVAERRRVTWEDNYLGQPADDDLPVVHVSWNDASAYANWLANATDRAYRLPTEAEFEYALRAGTQTPYWWGQDSPEEVVENLTGDGDQFSDQRRWTSAFRRYDDGYWGPAPVASFVANPFGLFDMGGNVMEWVRDCWHDSYVRAPSDGSAWINPGCGRRVIRGASWSSTPPMSRSAFRISSQETATDARVGFRVARDL